MSKIGLGIGIQYRGSSSWTQQRIATTFLFDAFTKDIAGGKLYNTVQGRTSEYLTVTGSAGSYHYTAPNNATYKAADTDYAWFKTDGSVSDMTDSRLNSYDLQRTPVKYDDLTPNTNRRISILLSTVTLAGTVRDNVFKTWQLPILWDNNLNGNGHIKDNRTGQNLWSPEVLNLGVVSAVIADATPTLVEMTFNLTLDKTSVPATTAFALAGKTITNVAISTTKVTLTVSVPYENGDTPTVNYTKPGSNMIKAAGSGMEAASFTGQAITNNILPYSLLLSSTGTGAEVSTIILTTSADITVTLDGNAHFYSNSGGTLDESQTRIVTTGASNTIYMKCTSGTSNMKFSKKSKLTQIRDWVRPANAPVISGVLTGFTNINFINIPGTNTLSITVTTLTALTYLFGVATMGGDVTNLTSLQTIGATTNTLTGSITNLTAIIYIAIGTGNTLSGSIAGLVHMTTFNVTGSNTITGDVDGLAALTSIFAGGNNTIGGNIGAISSHLNTECNLQVCAMNSFTAGASWGTSRVIILPSAGYGYNSATVDAILISMAASPTPISKLIRIKGSCQARTAASDAAVATLTGVGRTNTVETN